MSLSDIPLEIKYEFCEDKIKFSLDDVSTNCLSEDDSFIKRIEKSQLNENYLKKHAIKEIKIKNIFDDGIIFLNNNKYGKAIKCFDEVLFYDSQYFEALINKSYALFHQNHFIKALRFYKKAVKVNVNLADEEYAKLLNKKAASEYDNLGIKLNIYDGDEYFSKGDFKHALECYNNALKDSSKFNDKILSKLLIKKAMTLIELNDFNQAYDCFCQSLNIQSNDLAYYGEGFCLFNLKSKVSENFKKPLKIDKKYSLIQVSILIDLNLFDDALLVCDELLNNHFKEDSYLNKILEIRNIALNNSD